MNEKARTKRIGRITLHEGTNGRWVGMSIGRDGAFEQMLRREIEPVEYARRVKQHVRDELDAFALMGKRASR